MTSSTTASCCCHAAAGAATFATASPAVSLAASNTAGTSVAGTATAGPTANITAGYAAAAGATASAAACTAASTTAGTNASAATRYAVSAAAGVPSPVPPCVPPPVLQPGQPPVPQPVQYYYRSCSRCCSQCRSRYHNRSCTHSRNRYRTRSRPWSCTRPAPAPTAGPDAGPTASPYASPTAGLAAGSAASLTASLTASPTARPAAGLGSPAWDTRTRTKLNLKQVFCTVQKNPCLLVQWGLPTVSISCVCGLLSGILATTIESVGDYHACARLSGAPCPPTHGINRGILMEGLGSMLDALFGTGNGTTSTSINVGVIGLTKVGSRRVVQYSALFMIVLGVFNKFGALFVTIPDPVIGGSFFILFGMIVAVGISNLQYVDLNSSRNLFIIGFSFLLGMSLPQWVKANQHAIHTGSPTVDQALQVLLSTSMFVGGVVGFIFDNTIPGTQAERGLSHWNKMRSSSTNRQSPELAKRLADIYDLPFGMKMLSRYSFLRYFPICPFYGQADTQMEMVVLSAEEHRLTNLDADITVI